MKILMVNKFLHPNGGSETYIFQLGDQLKKIGHEVQFFGMDHPNRVVGNAMECYTSPMDFHTTKWKKLLYPFTIIYSREANKKMLKVLAYFKPDVVHFNNINFQLTPSVIYAIRKYEKKSGKKIKKVYTAHDYQWICPNHMLYIPQTKKLCISCVDCGFLSCVKNRCIHSSFFKSVLGAIEGWIYKVIKVYQHIDVIICPSHFMNKMLSRQPLLRDKTIVMHNFLENSGEKKAKTYGDYVLYFGRYAEEKGIETLLHVCRQLKDIPFLFAGGGPLEDLLVGIPNVKNIGFIQGEELRSVVREARFAVFPSEWFENCPFSVMEAQRYKTPVLGSDIGGIPELIQNQVTGELFACKDKLQLKEKIENMWNDEEKCRRYSENCNQISFDTVEEYCEKLIQLYR